MSVRAPALTRESASWGEWSWLSCREWDTKFLIGSAILVSVPLLIYHGLGVSVAAVNLLVAALVGGPHMYSTYTLTFLERRFWTQYPLYAAGALLVPVVVVFLAITNLTLLLMVFLAWASFHVLQQAAFIGDCYRSRGPREDSRWPRVVDYAVLLTSMYPFAVYKLVNDQFIVENRVLQVPTFLKSPLLVYLGCSAFAVALALYIAKSLIEAREGRLNFTKTVFISLTVACACIVPMFNQLDVAFQGMNAWHSFQYLAIIWLVNKSRKERGAISSSHINRLAGRDNTLRFYATLVGITLAGGIAVVALKLITSLSFEQCYYIVILGSLLVHYYFDSFLFTRAGVVMQDKLRARTGVWEWP